MRSRILLVDDNDIQAATRKTILEHSGKQVAIASNGVRALELLSHPETSGFGLIITDHFMPVMNGVEFVSEVRRRGFKVPIIVLSGMAEAKSAYDGCDVSFRVKPFAPEGLIGLANDLLRQAA